MCGRSIVGPERAVHADAQQVGMRDRVPERLDRLRRERAAAVEDGARGHHRHAVRRCRSKYCSMANRHAFRFSVSKAVSGKQQVDAAFDQRRDLLVVGGDHLVERRAAVAGVVDVAGDRELLVGRADRAGDEPRLVGRPLVHLVDGAPGQRHGGQVQLADVVRQAELGHGDAGRAERVGLDDVGAGFQILAVDLLDRLGLGQRQDVDEVLEILGVAGEQLPAEVRFRQLERMDHRAHGAVEHQNPLGQQLGYQFFRAGLLQNGHVDVSC